MADLLIKIKTLWSYMLFIIWFHKESTFWCTNPFSNKSDSLLIHSIFWSLLGNEVFIFMCKKNLMYNTNNIISKTVIHHHTCKTKALGKTAWQVRWTTSIFHQSNYSLLFSWTTSGNTNLKTVILETLHFFSVTL